MGACCVLACDRFLGTHSGVDLAGGWCLSQACIFAFLMMFNVSCLLLNSRSLLEYFFYKILSLQVNWILVHLSLLDPEATITLRPHGSNIVVVLSVVSVNLHSRSSARYPEYDF